MRFFELQYKKDEKIIRDLFCIRREHIKHFYSPLSEKLSYTLTIYGLLIEFAHCSKGFVNIKKDIFDSMDLILVVFSKSICILISNFI